jgi:hypothetical protein
MDSDPTEDYERFLDARAAQTNPVQPRSVEPSLSELWAQYDEHLTFGKAGDYKPQDELRASIEAAAQALNAQPPDEGLAFAVREVLDQWEMYGQNSTGVQRALENLKAVLTDTPSEP